MTMQTLVREHAGVATGRPARTYLMCPPTYFDIQYAINAWMNPATPVDRDRAVHEWERLRATYVSLGHSVFVLDPVEGLPDMVFAANGATVVGGMVLGARFRHPQRAREADAHRAWFATHGYHRITPPTHINEGEGDYVFAYRAIVAGHGFRTDPAAHNELHDAFGLPVISVRLVDPRFYHLDTALAVLDATTVAWFPGAFSPASRAVLADRYPDAVTATAADAAVLGLNAVSDGRHVVLPAEATDLAAALAERGFIPVPVEMSELLKGGGGPKCCTLEVRA
jgi:N-dimethylarginine dimethylaminohydrolase